MTHKISEPSRMCGAELWLRQLTGTLRRRGRLFAELYDDGCTSQVLLYMIALRLLHASHPFCVEVEGEKADVLYPAAALRVPQLIIVYLHPLQLSSP